MPRNTRNDKYLAYIDDERATNIMKTTGKPKKGGGASHGRWTKEEHEAFLEGLKKYGREWKKVADMIKTRTSAQIRSHAQKYFYKMGKKLTKLGDADGKDEQKQKDNGNSAAAIAASYANKRSGNNQYVRGRSLSIESRRKREKVRKRASESQLRKRKKKLNMLKKKMQQQKHMQANRYNSYVDKHGRLDDTTPESMVSHDTYAFEHIPPVSLGPTTMMQMNNGLSINPQHSVLNNSFFSQSFPIMSALERKNMSMSQVLSNGNENNVNKKKQGADEVARFALYHNPCCSPRSMEKLQSLDMDELEAVKILSSTQKFLMQLPPTEDRQKKMITSHGQAPVHMMQRIPPKSVVPQNVNRFPTSAKRLEKQLAPLAEIKAIRSTFSTAQM